MPRPSRRKPIKKLAQELIDGRRRLYEELRDPLRAWEIYFLARAAGLEVPACVSSYLDRVARRLTERSIALSEGRAPKGSIEQALELDGHGRGSISAKRAALRRQQQHVADVIEIMGKGYTQTQAIGRLLDLLGSSGRAADRRTIERAVRDYKRKGWRAAGGRGGGLPPEPSEWTRQIKTR